MGINIKQVLSYMLLAGIVGFSSNVLANTTWSKYAQPWFAKNDAVRIAANLNPTESIKALDKMLDSYKTGSKLSEADKAFNKDLKKEILSGTFDIKELVKVSLGRHWTERTVKEQDSLVDLMTSLLEEKAITSKEQSIQKSGNSSNVYSVKYLGDSFLDSTKQRALVRSKVAVPSHNISININYKVKLSAESKWKIYDVIVDESSLVENYAYQFDSIISKNGYQDLVDRMERKLKELRGETATATVVN